MKALYLDWKSLANNHILNAFKKKDYHVDIFDFTKYKDVKVSEAGTSLLVEKLLSQKYDFCFSFNYFPLAAIACKVCNVKYVSWTFDSPYVFLYSDTILFPTNYAFVFDRAEYINLLTVGVNTVHFLPMAADAAFYDSIVPTSSDYKKYGSDISHVGSMYSEPKHRLFDKFDRISPYTRGYLDALLSAQKQIYGADIMEQGLSDSIIEELSHDAPVLCPSDELQSKAWVYSKYFLSRELTRRERFEYIKALSERFNVSLYTYLPSKELPKASNKGFADYYKDMPLIFKTSKINLNISLRSIVTGIPLRCFDIMGCGGFLLTNYQADFGDFFVPNEDYVFYENCEDLLSKAEYYLSHDFERKEIAENGHRKILESHTYINRLTTIESILEEG